MTDILTKLKQRHRPRLLIRAARLGLGEYKRERSLNHHLGYGKHSNHHNALAALMDIETNLNVQRKSKDAGYSPAQHVDVMIAMMGEAQLLRASQTG